MSKKWIFLGIIVIGLFALGSCSVGLVNKEVRLRNQVEAQQEANTAVFDRTWKVISQQAQVATQHKEAFQEIYGEVMDNSAGGNNRLLAFIQSVNPQYDSTLFSNLQVSIEANRRDFEREQKKLIDINRQHKNLIQQFPGNIVLGSIFGKESIKITVVTSSKTTETFETGEEEDIDLFGDDG